MEAYVKYAKLSHKRGICIILFIKSLLIPAEMCTFANDICKLFNYLRERNYGKKINHVYGGAGS